MQRIYWRSARNVERAFLLCMLVAINSACVSIHWRNESGKTTHVGSIWYSYNRSENAQTVEVNSYGLDIRLQPNDPGLSLGYRKMISGSPADEIIGLKLDTGWLSTEEKISLQGYFRFTKNLGLDFSARSENPTFSIGYQQATFINIPDKNQSTIRRIDFYEDQPQKNRIVDLSRGTRQ